MQLLPGDTLLVLAGPYRGQTITIEGRYDEHVGMSWMDALVEGSSAMQAWAHIALDQEIPLDEEVYCALLEDSCLTVFVHRSQLESR